MVILIPQTKYEYQELIITDSQTNKAALYNYMYAYLSIKYVQIVEFCTVLYIPVFF